MQREQDRRRDGGGGGRALNGSGITARRHAHKTSSNFWGVLKPSSLVLLSHMGSFCSSCLPFWDPLPLQTSHVIVHPPPTSHKQPGWLAGVSVGAGRDNDARTWSAVPYREREGGCTNKHRPNVSNPGRETGSRRLRGRVHKMSANTS